MTIRNTGRKVLFKPATYMFADAIYGPEHP